MKSESAICLSPLQIAEEAAVHDVMVAMMVAALESEALIDEQHQSAAGHEVKMFVAGWV